jgi:phenylacetate-CoA ligase
VNCIEAWTLQQTSLSEPNAGALRDWQLSRLAETVAYVQAHSRFYSDRLWNFNGTLESLPFTKPTDIAQDPMAFLCVPQTEIARVTTLTTSGTSGPKKRIFFTKNDLERAVDFFALGMTMLVHEDQDTLILMGADTEHSIARLLKVAVERLGAHGRIGDIAGGAEETLEAARTADCIVGMPAELLYLCRLDGRLRPSTVLLSADFVPECVIAVLKEHWGCRVFTHFGMTETGFGCAVQCEVGEGHHVRHPELILEIVDPATGQAVPAGSRGEIVLTTFCHEAMPLLRYRTGDIASLIEASCACGGSLPRLGRVLGRYENQLGSGTLSIHQLDEWLFAMPAVRAFEAGLRIEANQQYLQLAVESTNTLNERALAAQLPNGLSLQVRYAEVSPFSRRGKRRIQAMSEPSDLPSQETCHERHPAQS